MKDREPQKTKLPRRRNLIAPLVVLAISVPIVGFISTVEVPESVSGIRFCSPIPETVDLPSSEVLIYTCTDGTKKIRTVPLTRDSKGYITSRDTSRAGISLIEYGRQDEVQQQYGQYTTGIDYPYSDKRRQIYLAVNQQATELVTAQSGKVTIQEERNDQAPLPLSRT